MEPRDNQRRALHATGTLSFIRAHPHFPYNSRWTQVLQILHRVSEVNWAVYAPTIYQPIFANAASRLLGPEQDLTGGHAHAIEAVKLQTQVDEMVQAKQAAPTPDADTAPADAAADTAPAADAADAE